MDVGSGSGSGLSTGDSFSVRDRLSRALAGQYSVLDELGQGGMATVYLAEDVKHHRKVAIKVLHPELSAVLGGDRFLKEIELTANLQHPHILPLFDSGSAEGLLYYVMPFVQGETLRSRMERERQLPIPDAVRIATDVADALEYAHKRGVVHRDIKPENILLHDGRPLIADFGIALAVQQAGGERMTQTGLSLGTPQYMSPEQATGERDIDARSDIYSLGAVTYEMLTGEAPFTGPTSQAIVAKVITTDPGSIVARRKSVPSHVEDAVFTALEKVPADRFASATAFGAALSGAATQTNTTARSRAVPTVAATGRWPGRLVIAAMSAAGIVLAVALIAWLRAAPAPGVSRQRVHLWDQAIDPALSPGAARVANQAAISPDGSRIVFTDMSATGSRLMIKLRHEPTAVPMAGTEGGTSPFFSPDGSWVGYLTGDSKLRKVPAGGGGSITLAEGTNFTNYAGAWLDDGTIVYAGTEGLRQVPAEGGASRSIGKVDRQSPISPVMISALPGGRAVLFISCGGNCAISSDLYVHDMGADSARMLLRGVASAWYAPTGHIVYTSRDGGLYAVGFDARDLEVKPGGIPIIDGVEPASFTMSASGTALYSMMRAGASLAELVWVSRDGTVEPLAPGWQEVFDYPAVSPDGSSVAVSVRDGPTHLWIRRSNGTRQRLTSSGTMNWRPVWSPDGRSITYISSGGDGGNPDVPIVHRIPVDGSAPTRQVLAHDFGVWEAEVSKDEKWLIIRADEIGGDTNIRARRLDGDSALIPLLTGTDNTLVIALSPDARWLAFESNSSGRREVYVASFPDIASIHLVSSNGGSEPRWSRSGRELFFKSGGNLVAVDVPSGSSFTPGLPKELFSVAPYRSARNRQQYDVSPDGRRFVMIRDLGGRAAEVIYVENWFTELAEKTKR